MKPKINRAAKSGAGYDQCQTPAYALDPLFPYLRAFWCIWEPAKGEGNLTAALSQRGFSWVASDILTGQDFFEWEPSYGWDCIVTNPPYSIKYRWLDRCYSFGKPFALLMPVEMLGAATAQRLFKQYGVEMILLDKRINFKMPNLGYSGHGAQFPVAWYTWGLNIGRQMSYAHIERTLEVA